jgi:hypothetical protein
MTRGYSLSDPEKEVNMTKRLPVMCPACVIAGAKK